MVFWIVLGLLTIIASLAIILPLSGSRREVAGAREHDLEVYRDQLAEIERDASRGLIGQDEAAQARAEIGRRILKLDVSGTGEVHTARDNALVRGLAMAAVVAVPMMSWGLYTAFGSPDMPGQPLAERLAKDPGSSSIDELVARAEAHLRANPDDGRGWDVVAPIYLRLERVSESATAFRNAIRLLGDSAPRWTGLGEALMAGAGGVVTTQAAEAFERAAALDPADPRPKFFLATAKAQEGDLVAAAGDLRAMLETLPAESPWRPMVEQTLAQATAEAQRRTGAAAPGPTSDDMRAAAELSDEERADMIQVMVERLDERLRENPQDAEGWQRLVRSYVVLQRRQDAQDALARGVAALGTDTEQARELTAFAAELGLGDAQP
ncbi:c-type cytochrome biogenesis protein CcmI [Aquibium carbonis]|uniref:C-type cytochrome biogenesis protein CcmI n=1 Tax=Aquibium carbonis TaxID=2495581 RepID=A0A429Z0P1_9HYPH|nr:c-type cytochrome biogenesis protein CcmI [Aquibium carbonis]RST87220.1 c-type cytochrome biogenesis protein CcmI [Aquibium carbonis]